MLFLSLKAYWYLMRSDWFLSHSGFSGLYRKIRDCAVTPNAVLSDPVQQVCSAINVACMWYWKEVQCLQRSAATALLLKEHGVHAQLIIGAQQLPFKAHAWVEVNGEVVNDKSYIAEIYAVLDRV